MHNIQCHLPSTTFRHTWSLKKRRTPLLSTRHAKLGQGNLPPFFLFSSEYLIPHNHLLVYAPKVTPSSSNMLVITVQCTDNAPNLFHAKISAHAYSGVYRTSETTVLNICMAFSSTLVFSKLQEHMLLSTSEMSC